MLISSWEAACFRFLVLEPAGDCRHWPAVFIFSLFFQQNHVIHIHVYVKAIFVIPTDICETIPIQPLFNSSILELPCIAFIVIHTDTLTFTEPPKI